jgi:hypothetical protein
MTAIITIKGGASVAINKTSCIKEAIEITKEYCRGGGGNDPPDKILEQLYKKLVKLYQDADLDDSSSS